MAKGVGSSLDSAALAGGLEGLLDTMNWFSGPLDDGLALTGRVGLGESEMQIIVDGDDRALLSCLPPAGRIEIDLTAVKIDLAPLELQNRARARHGV